MKMKQIAESFVRLHEDVLADCDSRIRNRDKYQQNRPTEKRLPFMLVKNIGVQSMAAIRLMQFARNARIPLGGEVLSRLIRYIYGMEIHWNADIAPGVSIVHGVGLVISHAARVRAGCILSQNVTLGEARDPKTKQMGAPTLEENVHVGPGATILGPITIGAESKIMAGAVVTESVPPRSLVSPPPPRVTRRTNEDTAASPEAILA